MQEYVSLECTECGRRNYRTMVNSRAKEKLKLKKYCPFERKHTEHRQSRK
ncbi:MAG: 50S ribosomal protein L33 [Planctomycetia bacterium]|nr:50S ribosomal protein L33 [Planctomycetia bacterium]